MPQKLEEVSRQKRTGEKINKSVFLTYLLQQKSLTPEEVNGHVVDLLMGAVETVSRVLVVKGERTRHRSTDGCSGNGESCFGC